MNYRALDNLAINDALAEPSTSRIGVNVIVSRQDRFQFGEIAIVADPSCQNRKVVTFGLWRIISDENTVSAEH